MAKSLFNDGNIEIRVESHHSIAPHDLLFFHSNEFINRKESASPVFFNLYESERPLASIAFEVADHLAISLPQSPFGGFIFDRLINQEVLEVYLKTIVQYYQNKNFGVQIKMAADGYHTFQKGIATALESLGFSLLYVETNQHVVIDQQDFAKKINRNRKRKLEMCSRQNYEFRKIDSSYLTESYRLISECRADKNYPVTMTLEALQVAFDSFPEQYLLFGIFDQSEMIATSVSIRVSNEILYNFYHGDRLSHRLSSPVTMLTSGIYAYCQEHSFKILDLGISTAKGVLNEGLYSFKKSCGAVSSDKRSYELKIR